MRNMNSPNGPDLCHCLAVRRAARYASRIYDSHLSAVGISVSQFSILALIDEHPGIVIADLADLMVMERTTLVRALGPLRDEQWLTSVAEGPKAALKFMLSAAGKAKLSEAEPCWRAAQAEFEAGVGPKQATALRAGLLSVVF
ncbi:MarR family winged helix-turn-helix transcriptional regulator [Cupriavidus sp. SIMBA_020]|uniref:MarR family winged helix-turn-helix transcriptional regulator n=1 Tax=Cupriavidus sp. SIMBA_020 TaxID=3085766 RepID=UPI00397BE321